MLGESSRGLADAAALVPQGRPSLPEHMCQEHRGRTRSPASTSTPVISKKADVCTEVTLSWGWLWEVASTKGTLQCQADRHLHIPAPLKG